MEEGWRRRIEVKGVEYGGERMGGRKQSGAIGEKKGGNVPFSFGIWLESFLEFSIRVKVIKIGIKIQLKGIKRYINA